MSDWDNGGDEQVATTIGQVVRGEIEPTPEVFAGLYRELHRLARHLVRTQGSNLTLGATTLLHEAYLALSRRDARFPDQARFFAYAARAMRGLIIDYVREQRAVKRGGEFHFTQLNTAVAEGVAAVDADEMAKLDEALKALGRVDAPLAELVDLKFFCGFSFAEIAAMRSVSERTVQRDWNKARLFLHGTLRAD